MDVILNTDSLSPPLAGIGNYTRQLLNGLLTHSAIGTVRRFGGRPDLATIDAGTAVAPADHLLHHFKRGMRAWPGAYALRAWLREQEFKWRFRHHVDAIYHEPNYILKRFPGRSVATVHDTSHLRFPQFHPPQRVAYLERHLPLTIGRADQLITLSEFMRGELMRLFAIAPARITAIPLGVDPSYRSYSVADTQPTLQRYGLAHGGYLLSVATLEPRKNLLGLLRAYRQLEPSLRARFPLVLAGASGWGNADLESELRKVGSSARRLGYLPAQELPHIYAGAAGFALVSHYEGFGLPALEALACGLPLLASERSALPEVAGDAALYVDPEDIDDMAKKLARLLEDGVLRKALSVAGIARAQRFGWRACVDQTVAVYRRAAAGN